MLVLFLLPHSRKVSFTRGDSRVTLLSAQALLEHGSTCISPYIEYTDTAALISHHWALISLQDKTYNFFPPGPTLLSIPAVFAGRLMGFHFAIPEHDDQMQNILIGLTLCLSFFLFYRLCQFYLNELAAWSFGLLWILTTTWGSTAATALWSHNFLLIILQLVLLEVLRYIKQGLPVRSIWLGFLLVLGFTCRPTLIALYPPLLIWLALNDRRALLKTLAAMATTAALWAVFTKWDMGVWLHPYFDSKYRPPNPMYFTALGFHLFSAARGLFVWMPVTACVFAGWFLRDIRRQPLYLMLFSWGVLHWLLICREGNMMGGWAYGPRFFTDFMPGMGLLVLMCGQAILQHLRGWLHSLVLTLGMACAAFGLYVHFLQGWYNEAVVQWYDAPNIDADYRRTWDWGYPQFMATYERNEQYRRLWIDFQVYRGVIRALPAQSYFLLPDKSPTGVVLAGMLNNFHELRDHKIIWDPAQTQDGLYTSLFTDVHHMHMLKSWPEWKHLAGPQDSSLAQALPQFLGGDYVMTFSVSGDGLRALSPESRTVLKPISPLADSAVPGMNWAFIARGGVIRSEDLQRERIARATWSGFEAWSGDSTGQSLSRNGYAGNMLPTAPEGIHIGIFDPAGKQVRHLHFDTAHTDRLLHRYVHFQR